MERMNLFQDNNKPQIIFYFAECMEFPDYGEYKEFPTLDQAISFFKKYSGTILNKVLTIHTLEGDMIASKGDYIITGVDGEQYPCKPDIFEKTYEPVED